MPFRWRARLTGRFHRAGWVLVAYRFGSLPLFNADDTVLPNLGRSRNEKERTEDGCAVEVTRADDVTRRRAAINPQSRRGIALTRALSLNAKCRMIPPALALVSYEAE